MAGARQRHNACPITNAARAASQPRLPTTKPTAIATKATKPSCNGQGTPSIAFQYRSPMRHPAITTLASSRTRTIVDPRLGRIGIVVTAAPGNGYPRFPRRIATMKTREFPNEFSSPDGTRTRDLLLEGRVGSSARVRTHPLLPRSEGSGSTAVRADRARSRRWLPQDARAEVGPEAIAPRARGGAALVRAGRSYRAIAFDLAVKERTVREYVERAYRKLGVNSRYELH